MAKIEFNRHGAPGGAGALAARLQRGWIPSVRSPRALLEVLIGMVGIVAFCAWLNPADPLLLGLGFPWLGVFALVFALRYGALLGAAAGGCLLVAWWLLYGGATFPRDYFSGLFTMLVLAGHFSDRWANRLSHEASTNQYLNGRLVSLTNSHYLLRISHDRVEKELLSQPTTLRDTIRHLRASIDVLPHGRILPNAQEFLNYLSTITQINEAAIFAAQGNGFSHTSSAHIGDDFTLDAKDPLLVKSIETGSLTHLREIADTHSTYLVCIPIRTALDELLGMLVVRRMFFMSLNHDMLQLMLVMLGYYADSTRQQPMISGVQRKVPGCPDDMALELARLGHLAESGGPVSHLVALVFSKDGVEQAVYAQMVRQRRGLDMVWAFETERARVMLVLLALTTESGVDGYVDRMEGILRAQFGLDFNKAHVGVYGEAINMKAPGTAMRHLMDQWNNV